MTIGCQFGLIPSFCSARECGRRLISLVWMGGRVVEGSGLENRRTCKRTVGSNPTPSATIFNYIID